MGGASTSGDVNADLTVLSQALHDGVGGMLAALDALGTRLGVLMGHVGAMERNLNIMRALEVNGRIEAVRAAQGDSVEALFRTIAEQVALARQEMSEFAEVGRLAEQRDTTGERALAHEVDLVGRHVAALAAA
jgi:aerotaxis receptor